MKTIEELDDIYPGEDIYIVGTGPSLRVFPRTYLDDKIVIGLNMAWKYVKTTYNITIHPDLNIPECIGWHGVDPSDVGPWIIPEKKTRELISPTTFELLAKTSFKFRYNGRTNTAPKNEPSTAGRIIKWVSHPEDYALYNWTSISQSAMHLAYRMGAKNIFLVGCDNGQMLGNDHVKSQHTRWKGASSELRYSQYAEGTCEIRNQLLKRNINIFNLCTILGLHQPEQEFVNLCEILQLDVKQHSFPIKTDTILKKILRKIEKKFK